MSLYDKKSGSSEKSLVSDYYQSKIEVQNNSENDKNVIDIFENAVKLLFFGQCRFLKKKSELKNTPY